MERKNGNNNKKIRIMGNKQIKGENYDLWREIKNIRSKHHFDGYCEN